MASTHFNTVTDSKQHLDLIFLPVSHSIYVPQSWYIPPLSRDKRLRENIPKTGVSQTLYKSINFEYVNPSSAQHARAQHPTTWLRGYKHGQINHKCARCVQNVETSCSCDRGHVMTFPPDFYPGVTQILIVFAMPSLKRT